MWAHYPWGTPLSLRKRIARTGVARLRTCERGATAIEYAMIIAMIALAASFAMNTVANKTMNMWSNVSNAVNNT